MKATETLLWPKVVARLEDNPINGYSMNSVQEAIQIVIDRGLYDDRPNLLSCCTWEETPQGDRYWDNLYYILT